MEINILVQNSPDSIQMTMEHLLNVQVTHDDNRIENFVVSMEDMCDFGYFDSDESDINIYNNIVALKQQTVLM